jgi:hypothetical protein
MRPRNAPKNLAANWETLEITHYSKALVTSKPEH